MKKSNKQKRFHIHRQNKTKKKLGGVAPIILVLENLPTIITGVSKGFNIVMEWIVTANKTIDNYNTIKKIIKPKASNDEETKKPAVVSPPETKKPAVVTTKNKRK